MHAWTLIPITGKSPLRAFDKQRSFWCDARRVVSSVKAAFIFSVSSKPKICFCICSSIITQNYYFITSTEFYSNRINKNCSQCINILYSIIIHKSRRLLLSQSEIRSWLLFTVYYTHTHIEKFYLLDINFKRQRQKKQHIFTSKNKIPHAIITKTKYINRRENVFSDGYVNWQVLFLSVTNTTHTYMEITEASNCLINKRNLIIECGIVHSTSVPSHNVISKSAVTDSKLHEVWFGISFADKPTNIVFFYN